MFGDFQKSRKRRKQKKLDRLAGSIEASLPPLPGSDSGLAVEGSPEDGIPLEVYAEQHGIPASEVWSMVRRGDIVGRTERGRLLIFEPEASGDLPPLPLPAASEPSTTMASSDENALAPVAQSTEVALLIDHLSLSKEENREILRLTQDALSRVSTITDNMIKMKDQLIAAKDEQLEAMRQILALRDSEVRKLKQEREDLEILTRTLSDNKSR